ncbi:ATP-binding protein [Aggregatilinea lenta]|uniref:ATP-binding protein n=1 Tax=Aggregatilinea lenta TaxID=913108 RepID=UPI0013C3130E|nr:ATP-binding protein [Aggregatilinea lenta]
MRTDAITPELVKRALEGWQHDRLPPQALFGLRLLPHKDMTPTDLSRDLFRLFRAITFENVQALRRSAGLSSSDETDTPLLAIKADFQVKRARPSRTLKAWSAVYHRYLGPHHLNISDLADAAGYSPRNFRRHVNQGIKLLTHTLRDLERGASSFAVAPGAHIPPPDYHKLYGVEAFVEHLTALLHSPSAPPFISLEGIGGIGKTALAREVAWRLNRQPDWHGVLWISAQSERFTNAGHLDPINNPVRTADDVIAEIARQLSLDEFSGAPSALTFNRVRSALSRRQHLVVLDRVDALADPDLLLSRMAQLAESTRFMLTSRNGLGGCPYVQVVKVPELSLEHSEALLRDALMAAGRTSVLADDPLVAIFDAVGGNPLALKFFAFQLTRLPLTRVLQDLRTAQSEMVANLYAYLYRQSWQSLRPPACALLSKATAQSPALGQDNFRHVGHCSTASLESAVEQLIACSLVKVSGSLQAPQYRLHTLTHTFSQARISEHWQEQDREHDAQVGRH